MELGSPVILISAFGRGHWLAAALAKEGIKTTLVDVSAKLGVWPAEDIEGPFGYFRNEKISSLQRERLSSDDPYEEVTNGLTLWLKQGPVELRGPLMKFFSEKPELSPKLRHFFQGSLSSAKKRETYKQLGLLSFQESWLLHFAHQWASTSYVPNPRGAEVGEPLPLNSLFSMRRASRGGLDRSLEWLASKGVEVIKPHQLMDAAFGGGSVTGIELTGERQGLFRCDKIVWLLTSEETYFLNERLGKYFFSEGPLEAEWCWIRYRMSLQSCSERDRLPLHLVLVDDLDSPWTHENLMVLQRTSLGEQFDAWIRIPTVQRFNKEYLSERSLRISHILQNRMPLTNPQILSFPQEYYYLYAQLGPSRFPVFSERQSLRRGKSRYKNLYLDSSETWPHYSLATTFDIHEVICDKLTSWWKDKLQKEQKQKRREQSQ